MKKLIIILLVTLSLSACVTGKSVVVTNKALFDRADVASDATDVPDFSAK